MTKYMANHIRTTLEDLAEHIEATNSGRKYLHRIATAIEAISYEIDLMCADEAEAMERYTNPELDTMIDDVDEFLANGINLCRKYRAA